MNSFCISFRKVYRSQSHSHKILTIQQGEPIECFDHKEKPSIRNRNELATPLLIDIENAKSSMDVEGPLQYNSFLLECIVMIMNNVYGG